MHKIYQVPTTVPVVKTSFLFEDYLIHFENEIRKNVGVLDYKTNVKGQMTSFQYFLKDQKFNSFLNIFSQIMTNVAKDGDPLQLKNLIQCK